MARAKLLELDYAMILQSHNAGFQATARVH